MLREVKNISQKDKNRIRRWFEDDFFDLIVWYDLNNDIIGFQLCYDKYDKDERVLTWRKAYGFSHDKIDDGRSSFRAPRTPVLVADGIFPAKQILEKFKDACGNIDYEISGLVINKIDEYMKDQ